ncbi:hypothetical protein LTR37_012523 [Vermiconidia calcicola]|uniref:Uncharacterized protein n=1 Tax=Vermiconidia calcicola TaxID=1690605 RepID=A0ACC3N0M1_9PEZI|nr:hypothetical protein LTR37_012523 [Vermiconidia calcicola]
MQMVKKFEQWLDLVHALGCDIIQVPSNFDRSGTTGSMDKLVADMVEIADLAAQQDPVVRIAYEAVAWGAHIDLWEQSWEVVKKVERPNLGLCLDTFHIAGRDLDVSKVFYIQLSDAEKLENPLIEGHEFYNAAQPACMSWSRNARLFPCEEEYGGHMPIVPIARAIVNKLGYRGWISMEIFSRHLLSSEEGIPVEYAKRARRSYDKVYERLGWNALDDREIRETFSRVPFTMNAPSLRTMSSMATRLKKRCESESAKAEGIFVPTMVKQPNRTAGSIVPSKVRTVWAVPQDLSRHISSPHPLALFPITTLVIEDHPGTKRES